MLMKATAGYAVLESFVSKSSPLPCRAFFVYEMNVALE